jgi:hypothetical protein
MTAGMVHVTNRTPCLATLGAEQFAVVTALRAGAGAVEVENRL